jgi:hypothetical protein
VALFIASAATGSVGGRPVGTGLAQALLNVIVHRARSYSAIQGSTGIMSTVVSPSPSAIMPVASRDLPWVRLFTRSSWVMPLSPALSFVIN